MPANYEPLLSQQIDEFGGGADVPAPFRALLKQINDTYRKFAEEQKQSEDTIKLRTEQLIASTSRAYSFLDSLHMGFIMCDVNPEVVLTNDTVRRFLSQEDEDGVPQVIQSEWTLKAIDQLLQPQLELKELVTKSLQTDQPKEFKEVNIGKRVVRLFIAPMVNEVKGEKEKIGAVILVEDITEQKVLERAKDEFFFIASHELRTPLTAIRGSASVIKKYYSDTLKDPDMAEMIDDIHESSVRLIEIVNDFLDASSLEQGKIQMRPETFELKDVVGDVVREMQSVCDTKGIELVSDLSLATLPAVTADKQRIKQVVYNLVGNAIKFTEKGSITISATADGEFVRCVVTDTGRGMSADKHALLFRKFQQAGASLLTRDGTKGTGLGLYISKLIVELSGGKISLVSSEEGKGSSFAFSLPRAKS